MQYPIAKTFQQVLTAHEHSRIDEYYWLRYRETNEVGEYIAAENHYTEKWLSKHADLNHQLFEEIKGRIPQTEESVPFKFDDYYYYSRIEETHEYPIYCRKLNTLESPEEVLLDVNLLAEGFRYFSLGMFEVNAAENMLAYAIDTVGNQIYTVFFKDLNTGQTLPAQLNNVCSFSWSNQFDTLYYTAYDKAQRPFKVFRHTLGTPQKQDLLVFHEKNPRFACYIFRTQSKKYMLIETDSANTSEAWYLDADNPNDLPHLIQKRVRMVEYNTDHYEDYFYILTNHQAPNFKLVRTPIHSPEMNHWEEVIPHRNDTLLEDFHIFRDFLVLEERQNGLPQIRIKTWDASTDYYLPFPDPTFTASVGENYLFDTDLLRYVYSSLNMPPCVFDFNMKTKAQTLLKQEEVLGEFDPALYQSEYLFATAPDGIKVPISLVYRTDLFHKNGNNPLLLYAYGAYGVVSEPSFSRALLPLLDRGFVYAIAHVRGGEELGRKWYEQGKLLQKKNSFTDFITIADFLSEQQYTQPSLMFVEGGSAGGMLIAAVLNERPDICKAALLQVPFVDVLTTMLDDELPLTIGEYDEWGNPNLLKFYQTMLSYSPYDNITHQVYPHILVTASINDSNVPYWEALKYVAKLRANKKGNNLLLLSIDLDSGHQGASGRNDGYREIALEYTFILSLLE